MSKNSCQNCKANFTIESDDLLFYEKMQVPAPTFCPQCRFIRRFTYRNERSLYRRTCDATGKPVMSVYAPDKPYVVYSSSAWWSDDWEGLDYGVEYDPEQGLIEQVYDLSKRVPRMALHSLYSTLENSEYTQMVGYLKNCYLLTHSDFCENCHYGNILTNSKDCVECMMLDKCELCYECVNCQKCYATLYSVDCISCTDVWFSRNCVGCANCFGCTNLRSKSYYIFNKPYSEEDYHAWIKENVPRTRESLEGWRRQIIDHWDQYPVKYIHANHVVDVSGDYIYHSKNAKYCYVVHDMEHAKYCSYVTPGGAKDMYDFSHYGTESELLYEVFQSGNQVSNIKFTWLAITSCTNIEYSQEIINSHNIFGCVGLKKKQYCILNKQYSKNDYMELRSKIINDMNQHPYVNRLGHEYRYGEFFPPEHSPFGYNETSANELFPMAQGKALDRGYSWYEKEPTRYTTTVLGEDLPQSVHDLQFDVTHEVITCVETGQAYRIVQSEVEFYSKMNLPLSNVHPDVRYKRRLIYKNRPVFYERVTDDGKEVVTTYAPHQPTRILSEKGYQEEVI